MADCDKISGCLFFGGRMANMPALSDMLRNRYCRGNFMGCARYIVCTANGKAAVPVDLFPNQNDKVAALLAKPST